VPHAIELLHPDLPELLDELLRRQGWSWESVERGDARLPGAPGKPVTLRDLEWFLINADPVLWGECNLVNRLEDGGGLWRFFDYQKPSLRLRRHVVHQDGAEVGKTREIITLIGWGLIGLQRGSILVGSSLDGDLDEIWEELQFQLASNPFLAAQVAKSTTKPYRRLTFTNGLKVLFRPAGHDGSAFRGVHVRGWLLHDEAAKVTNPRSFAEFWRAAKPGAEIRIYSVPTGDRLCTFQRIADAALPAERVLPDTWDVRTVVNTLLGRRLVPEGSAARTVARDLGGRVWVRFHWPKTIMPAPFWSEERRQDFVAMYGSPDDPGYVHNVLGLPGDPEYSVFPARLLDPATRYIPDYQTVELRWDHRAHRLDVLSRRLNPQHVPTAPGTEDEESVHRANDDVEAEGIALSPYVEDYRDSLDVADFHTLPQEEKRARIAELARSVIRRPAGFLTGGIDVGSASVTEINLEASAPGGLDSWKLRLHLTGWDWYAQRDLILVLDEILHPAGGWGLDATGVGKTLLDILQGESDELRDRLSGFIFNAVVPALNPETGEPQTDPQTGRVPNITYKELGTQLLERALARRAKEIPADPELLHLLQNHTYTETPHGRTFSKRNDHAVDAWRTVELRRYVCAFGAATTTPPVTFKALPGRYDSAALETFA
jgi:hypothetical protein